MCGRKWAGLVTTKGKVEEWCRPGPQVQRMSIEGGNIVCKVRPGCRDIIRQNTR